MIAAPIKDYGDTTFITGMRAYASLAVVLAHTGGAGLRSLGPIGERLAHFGVYGVNVFFVISGFSVAASYSVSGSFRSHLVRRLLRIAPLYYFWIAVACLTGATASEWIHKYGVPIDTYNLAMHVSFMSFLDYRIACTILGVEWSLPIEVVWYLAIPPLLLWMRDTKAVGTAVALSVASVFPVACVKGQLPLPADDAAYAILWSPLPHAPAFVLGVAAYRVRQWRPDLRKWAGIVVGLGAVMVGLLASADWSLSASSYPLLFAALTAGLIATGSRASATCNTLFCNPALLFVGTISYGLYLSHFPIFRHLQYAGVVTAEDAVGSFIWTATVATVVSTMTYYLCERPGQRLAVAWTTGRRG